MISLTNHDFQWGRSEVVIIYPDWIKSFEYPNISTITRHTVDGCELLHQLIPSFWWCRISQPSTVDLKLGLPKLIIHFAIHFTRFFHRFSIFSPSILGTPHLWKPTLGMSKLCLALHTDILQTWKALWTSYGVSKFVVPQNGWFIWTILRKIDDLG